jgi:hypothetical protein
MDPARVSSYAANQEAVLAEFIGLAGLKDVPGPVDDNWQEVIEAGLNYSQAECDSFMEALFKWRRKQDAIGRQIDVFQTAANAAFAALKVAAEDLTLTGAAFGLAKGTLDNIKQSALVSVEPSGVKATVNKLQVQYRLAVSRSSYRTRASAVDVIARFHALCLPASIEAEINQKIDDKGSVVDTNPTKTGGAPIVAPASDIAALQWSYSVTDVQNQLTQFLIDPVTGDYRPAAVQKLDECLVKLKLPKASNPGSVVYNDRYFGQQANIWACVKS